MSYPYHLHSNRNTNDDDTYHLHSNRNTNDDDTYHLHSNSNSEKLGSSPFVARPTVVAGFDTPPLHPPHPPTHESPSFPSNTNIERTIAEVASFDFLSHTYNLARIVKFIAAIDMFFAFWYIFSVPYIFLYSFANLLMGMIGYHGAAKYKKYQVSSYFIYCVIKIVISIVLIIAVSIAHKDPDVVSSVEGFVVINGLFVLLEIYLACIVFRLCKALKNATLFQLTELRSGPRAVRLLLW